MSWPMSWHEPEAKVWACIGWPMLFMWSRVEVRLGENGLVDLYACTASPQYGDLLVGLERILAGEGGPVRVRYAGSKVLVPNPDVVRVPVREVFGGDSLVLVPKLGGRFVQLKAVVGDYVYRTRALGRAVAALAAARGFAGESTEA